MSNDFKTAPIDPTSQERLAAQNLRLALVDTTDTDAFGIWIQAEARGFHSGTTSDEALAAQVKGLADRRTTGVWDETAADPAAPVSTVSSWVAELTVPGETSVPAWAISAVTVSPTHRRRGIARSMLESELRTARSLGVAVAMLTVSEATIYSRYGFAPAAMMADWKVDARRATWAGPVASGRVHFITLEQLRDQGLDLVERVRLDVPGQMQFSGYLWERLMGLAGDSPEQIKKLRAVRYDDIDGEPEGFAIFSIKDEGGDFSANTLELKYLVAATDDAYAGLWRFLLEMDLVETITASLLSTEEPVVWQVSDFRSVQKTLQRDHLWTRIIDVPAALEACSYEASGSILLDVSDPLGFAAGRFLLEVDEEGTATVLTLAPETANDQLPEDAAAISLSVNELSAIYLGGVSAVTLARAGRVVELTDDASVAVDAAFLSTVTPWLSIWF